MVALAGSVLNWSWLVVALAGSVLNWSWLTLTLGEAGGCTQYYGNLSRLHITMILAILHRPVIAGGINADLVSMNLPSELCSAFSP